MNDRSKRWALWLGLLLVGTLLAGPVVLAAQEDVQQQGTTEKSDKKQADEEKKASDGKEEAAKPEPAVDSSFNTVEDVLAYRGSVRSLWTARAATEPVVQWRDADAGKNPER